MTQLGDFWCKNRKPNSLDCKKGLECPRAYQECDLFEPDGKAILDLILEEWLSKAQKGNGLTDPMIGRLRTAIVKSKGVVMDD